MPPEPARAPILLIEDDPGHARLVEKNLRRAGLENPIQVFRDGHEACAFLFSPDGPAPEPLLILLDLNMPTIDGYAVLCRLRADGRTRGIPVVILTTTDDEREKERCHRLGCDLYLTKSVDYEVFCRTVQGLGRLLLERMTPGRDAGFRRPLRADGGGSEEE
jgi:CheY-like chemotaxis protein